MFWLVDRFKGDSILFYGIERFGGLDRLTHTFSASARYSSAFLSNNLEIKLGMNKPNIHHYIALSSYADRRLNILQTTECTTFHRRIHRWQFLKLKFNAPQITPWFVFSGVGVLRVQPHRDAGRSQSSPHHRETCCRLLVGRFTEGYSQQTVPHACTSHRHSWWDGQQGVPVSMNPITERNDYHKRRIAV